MCPPRFVLCRRKSLVHFFLRHKFLFPPATMRSRHGLQINGFLFTIRAGSLSSIVSETIFNADDDPKKNAQFLVGHSALCSGSLCRKTKTAYHRFVKTTPNPRATKNNKGELVGPLLLPPAINWEGVGVAKADVMEVINDGDSEFDGMWWRGGMGGS